MSAKPTRRQVLQWACASIGATLVASCGATPTPKPAPAPPTAVPTVAAQPPPTATKPPAPLTAVPTVAAKPITLRFMVRQGPMGEHMREFSKRYAAESNGKINVETEDVDWGVVATKIETQVATGTMADLAWGDTAFWPYLAKRGTWLVIEDLVIDQKMDVSNWFNLEWFRKWTNGKLSGLGGDSGINQCLAFYNKDWVVSAWGKEPTDDWTMDDYVSCMAACVKAKGKGYYGSNAPIGGNHACDGWIRNWGGFYINAEGTKSLFAEDKCQIGIKWLMDQVKSGNFPPRQDAAQGDTQLFLAGKMAILVSNPAASQGMVTGCEQNKISLGVVLAPKGPSCFETPPRRAFVPYALTYGIWAKTKYPKEAFGLMLRVTSNESQKWLTMATGKQPGSRLDLWYDPDIVKKFPWFPKVADLMKTCKDVFPMPANTRFNEWSTVGANEIPPLVYGEVAYTQANIKAISDHQQEIIDLAMPPSFK